VRGRVCGGLGAILSGSVLSFAHGGSLGIVWAVGSIDFMANAKGISVGATADRVYVCVVGRGTFQNSQPLCQYTTEMVNRGFTRFTVDIGQCTAMDSTFLGVLAGIGLRLGQKQAAGGEVSLVNVDSRQRELLTTLGLDRLFVIHPRNGQSADSVIPGEVQLQPLAESDVKPGDKDAAARVMLDAHRNLIQADDRNLPKFENLTDQLTRRVGEPPEPER